LINFLRKMTASGRIALFAQYAIGGEPKLVGYYSETISAERGEARAELAAHIRNLAQEEPREKVAWALASTFLRGARGGRAHLSRAQEYEMKRKHLGFRLRDARDRRQIALPFDEP
jgi:hypothetical protein